MSTDRTDKRGVRVPSSSAAAGRGSEGRRGGGQRKAKHLLENALVCALTSTATYRLLDTVIDSNIEYGPG